MSRLEDLGISAYGFGTESAMNYTDTDTSFTDGQEDEIRVEYLEEDILDLCDANESLDAIFTAGLVDGLESVNDTYRLILMSGAVGMMDAGIESSDIGVMLNAAGVDIGEYSAGIETEYEGGAVQPLRKAGKWVSDSKAYKAVSDSFVGKGIRSVYTRIKKFLNWLKELIFGKAKKQADQTIEAVASKAPNANKIKAEAESKWKKRAEDLEAKLSQIYDSKTGKIKESFVFEIMKDVLEPLAREMGKMADDSLKSVNDIADGLRAEVSKLKKESKYNNMDISDAEIVDNKPKGLPYNPTVASNTSTGVTRGLPPGSGSSGMTDEERAARDEARERADREEASNLINNVQEAIPPETLNRLAVAHYNRKGMQRVSVAITKAADKLLPALSSSNSPEASRIATGLARVVQTIASSENKTMIGARKLEKLLKSRKGVGKGNMGKSVLKKRKSNLKRGAGESVEIFGMSSIFELESGLESESYVEEISEEELFDDMIEEYTVASESPDIDIAIAKYNMLLATEAGLEAMNMEHFGHPYIGLEFDAMKIYGITPGMEAEDLGNTATKDDKKDESKSEENKDKKEEGGFSKSLSKFGRSIKRAPKWIAQQFKKLFRWLASKSSIIEGLFVKIQRLFSKNADLGAKLKELSNNNADSVKEFKNGVRDLCLTIASINAGIEYYNSNKSRFKAAENNTEEAQSLSKEYYEKVATDKKGEELQSEVEKDLELLKMDKVSSARVDILSALRLDKYAKMVRKIRKFQNSKDIDIYVKVLDIKSLDVFKQAIADLNRGILRATAALRIMLNDTPEKFKERIAKRNSIRDKQFKKENPPKTDTPPAGDGADK